MFDLLAAHGAIAAAVALLAIAWLVLFAGTWIISEDESGLVIKKFGAALPPGRLIALAGEAGYQADLLPPGWHFGLWRWKYRVERVPMLAVRSGEIALVVSADGAGIPGERILGHEVDSDDFQNARAFLENGGEKGRQLAFLTAGTYRIRVVSLSSLTFSRAKTSSKASIHSSASGM